VTWLDSQTATTPRVDVDPIRAPVRDRQANFQLPSQAGHFAVRYDDADQLAAILDVNPSPLESELTYDAQPTAIAAWQHDQDQQVAEEEESAAAVELTRLEALQQPYWWYLLLAAVAAFAVETVYSAVVGKRNTQEQQPAN
jgi:hypothetical protein